MNLKMSFIAITWKDFIALFLKQDTPNFRANYKSVCVTIRVGFRKAKAVVFTPYSTRLFRLFKAQLTFNAVFPLPFEILF